MAPIAKMSDVDKVGVVFREAAKHLPRTVGNALLDIISPANLAITVALFVAFAAGQALGYGWIVDIVAIGGGLLLAGASALDGVKYLVEAVAKTASAKSQLDLQDAGKALAQAVLALGVGTLIALLTKKAVVKTRMAGTATVMARGRYPTYGELRGTVRTSELKGEFEAHHLWEKQFAALIGVAEEDIIAAPVLRRYHRAVNGIVKTRGQPLGIPYGVIDSNIDVMITNYIEQRLRVPRASATIQQVWVAHREVYLRLGQGSWADAIYDLYVKPRGIPYWGGAR
ncbi:hypothetical protein [Sorangium cellulosum]|nr:hypothetical protein [Sorangium cellulosum]